MKHAHTPLLFFCLILLLTACEKQPVQPVIDFIGISTGSLATNLDDLNFQESFSVDEHEIIGIVSFDTIAEGTIVQATWFSPDDRKMPLGRNTITVESGATIARFSIAGKADWVPAPYMLDIRTQTPDKEHPKSASGQVHFFFGLEDAQIEEYKADYSAWQEEQAKKREGYDRQKKKEEAILIVAKELLKAKDAGIGHRYDITKNGTDDLIIVDPMPEDMLPGSTESGALFSMELDQLAIIDMSGSTLLSLQSESKKTKILSQSGSTVSPIATKEMVTLHIFEKTLRFDWPNDDETCMVTIDLQEGLFVETKRECVVKPFDEAQGKEEEEEGIEEIEDEEE